MIERLTFTENLTADQATKRLDAALADLLPKYSRSQLTKWIKDGDILLDGKKGKPTYKVKGIETITFDCPLPPQTLLIPQDVALNIHYEDEHLLILNKQAGIVVHPGAGNPDNTIVNGLLNHDSSLAQLPRGGIIHRLDKDTTGLLIVAKTLESYHALIKMMQEREIHRHYQAVVYGECIDPQTIETNMGRHPTSRTRMAVVKQGKHATTHIEPLETFTAVTHLDIKLDTGRTHQIRVHLTHIELPLIGDQTYIQKNTQRLAEVKLETTFSEFNRQALHAYKLQFAHPITHQPLHFEIDLPQDMQTLLEKIRDLSCYDGCEDEYDDFDEDFDW